MIVPKFISLLNFGIIPCITLLKIWNNYYAESKCSTILKTPSYFPINSDIKSSTVVPKPPHTVPNSHLENPQRNFSHTIHPSPPFHPPLPLFTLHKTRINHPPRRDYLVDLLTARYRLPARQNSPGHLSSASSFSTCRHAGLTPPWIQADPINRRSHGREAEGPVDEQGRESGDRLDGSSVLHVQVRRRGWQGALYLFAARGREQWERLVLILIG